jgi:hypothetical protein
MYIKLNKGVYLAHKVANGWMSLKMTFIFSACSLALGRCIIETIARKLYILMIHYKSL